MKLKIISVGDKAFDWSKIVRGSKYCILLKCSFRFMHRGRMFFSLTQFHRRLLFIYLFGVLNTFERHLQK